jgi:hypothetical protein
MKSEKGSIRAYNKVLIKNFKNAEMIPVETVPGIRGGGMRESSGGGESKYDIFDKLKEP